MVQGKKTGGLPSSDSTTSTNYGATFEISSTAIAVLRACKQRKEFAAWMNYKKYEPSWDDLVLEVDEKIVCVQLKHNKKFDKRVLNTCLNDRQALLDKYPLEKDKLVFVFFATASDDTSVKTSYPAVESVPDFLNLLITNKSNVYYDPDKKFGETYFCMKQNDISTETADVKKALKEFIGQNLLSEDHLKDIQIKFLDYLQKRYQRRLLGEEPLTRSEISNKLSYAILSQLKVEYKPTNTTIKVSNNLQDVMKTSSLIVFDHRWSCPFKENVWQHINAYLAESSSKNRLKQSEVDELWENGKLHMPIVSDSKETDKMILRALEIADFVPKVLILRPRIFKIKPGQTIITILQNLEVAGTPLSMQTAEDTETFKHSNVNLKALMTNRAVQLHPDAFCAIAKDYLKDSNNLPDNIVEAHDEFHYVNDANIVGDQVLPALFAAIKINQIDLKIIEHIIDLGADVNASVLGGYRPILFAVNANRPDIVELLLERGANPDPADKDGNRPLFVACIENKVKIVELLVKHGSDRNTSDVNGVRPLFMAYQHGNFEVMRILLTNFDKPAAANTQGSHILHQAGADGSVECLKCILECCPNVKIFMTGDVMGETPLSLAKANKRDEFVEILEKALAN